jgi:hypothetical protein
VSTGKMRWGGTKRMAEEVYRSVVRRLSTHNFLHCIGAHMGNGIDQNFLPAEITAKSINLPCGGSATVLTREQMTKLYGCSHGELGRLLCRKQAPLPVRIEGTILFYTDEALNMHAQVSRTLDRWRHR